jgi:hydrogenase maturation protease
MTSGRVVVAGVGNIFLGDDGFGVEVARELAGVALPAGVEVIDVGVRGVHLAYDLLDGCDLLILVDTAARGAPPGTVSLLEAHPGVAPAGAPLIDPHSLAPDDVLALLRRLGGQPARTLVVACEPADLGAGMELSAPVRAAVPEAVRLVEAILEEAGDASNTDQGSAGRSGRDPADPVAPGHPAVRGDVTNVRTSADA